MPDAGNPYRPGEPVAEPGRFFGRGDLLASVREQLVRERRVVIVAGASQIGKTSFLYQLSAELPDGFFPVRVGLADEPAKRFDWLVWRMAQAVAREVSRRLTEPLPEPAWEEYEGRPDHFLGEFWPQIRERIGDRIAVLMLDDLDCLGGEPGELLGSLDALLHRWRRQDHRITFVFAVGTARLALLEREYPALFAGAHSVALGPLSSEDAIRLITLPVEGRVTYDQGVPRRLVELTSGQPYYLQLVCAEVFNRCAGEGWVNQHDVDLVLEELSGREISQFRRLWDESSPREQAVLAVLAALRGARGVATANEVHGILARAGQRATPAQVVDALERLSAREIVERLGALSYRLRVALLRDWLAKHFDLQQAMRSARWEPPGRRRVRETPSTASKPLRKPDPAEGEKAAGARSTKDTKEHQRGWGWLVAVGVVCAALILVASWSRWRPGQVEPTAASQATAVVVSRPTERALTPGATSPKPTASPAPTSTPSPTAPVVTSRSLPAIAYLSKPREEGLWTIYLMGSDGSNRIPVTEASSDFVSAPSWSPRGDRLAFVSDRDGYADIWVVGRDGRVAVNLTRDKAKDNSPAWSPDGQWIAFSSVRDSPYWELYVMRADGSEVRRLTWWEDASDLWPSWSPDGSRLAFASKRDGNWEIYTVAVDGGDLTRLTDNPADDMHPAWSPDGQWISFDSLRDGYSDVFVVRAAGGDARNLTSLAWASDLGPTWSPDGSRIAFYSDRNGDWDVYAMAVDGSSLVRLTTEDTQDQLPAWRP